MMQWQRKGIEGVVMERTSTAWGILWRSQNRLDGKTEYLMGDTATPARTLLFQTRRGARRFRDDNLGYIKTRPDLRAEPHGWKTPKVVKVIITVRTAKGVKDDAN